MTSSVSLARKRVRLTTAQLRVLAQLAGGLSYRKIATELGVKQTTVRSHVIALQRHLGVTSNVALVLAATFVGLLAGDAWPVQLTGVRDFDPELLHWPSGLESPSHAPD